MKENFLNRKKAQKEEKQNSRVGKTFTLQELQKLFTGKKIKAIIS